MNKKVVLGLSDGVDSAVAAKVLLDKGYEVHALYLDIGGEKEKQDAKNSACRLGIPLKIADIKQELDKKVIIPFVDEYLRGRTPNPCIGCNPNLKMNALINYADEINAQYIATGHYSLCDGTRIYTGNPENDQSYMLMRLTPNQVNRLLLPLGEYNKPQVREIAKQMGLSVYDKPDSLENCFIKGMSYCDWLEKRTKVPGEGAVMYNGRQVGTHMGIHRFTVGQRYSEMFNDRRVYVSKIDAVTNTIYLCLWEELFKTRFTVTNMSYISGTAPSTAFRARVRVRHTRWEMPLSTVTPIQNGVLVETDEPVRAPAPGQAAAFYDQNILLGGGYIDDTFA